MEAGEIQAAIPFFFALILVELLVGGRNLYGLNDSIADLGNGIGQQVLGIPLTALLVLIYSWVYEKTALIHLPPSSLRTWIVAFILVDLAYYCFHRMSHRVSFIWATHIVHHQSEEYNLAVALRQSWLQGLLSMRVERELLTRKPKPASLFISWKDSRDPWFATVPESTKNASSNRGEASHRYSPCTRSDLSPWNRKASYPRNDSPPPMEG